MKYFVDKKDVGINGPGQYVFKEGKRTRVVTVTGTVGAEQAHKRQCDVNYILRDYAKTGLLKHATKYQGQYDDVTIDSFQDAMFLVTRAQNMFNDLPSEIRKECNNNPAEFLKFVQDPKNKERMEELGILKGNDGLNSVGAPSGAPVATPQTPPQAPPESPPAA